MSSSPKAQSSTTSKEDSSKLMRACVVEKFGEDIKVKRVPIPKPKPGQVLIKMEASPINPSDISFVAGKYGIKSDPPFKVGLEGSGKIVENGGGLLGWYYLGKRVAAISVASTIGAWAEYMITMDKQVIPLTDNISYEQGASFFVNPLTAMAFKGFMEKGKHKAAVLTAAASAVGKMFFNVMKEDGKDVICIVRREDQVQTMKDLGAKYVINSSEEGFEKKVKELSFKLNATCFFDGIGGDMTWSVLKNMPSFTVCYVYGHLSNKPTNGVDVSHLIFTNKEIKGYYLGVWIRQQGLGERFVLTKYLRSHLDSTLKTEIAKSFPLERVNEALKFYTENMSLGKVLIKPNL